MGSHGKSRASRVVRSTSTPFQAGHELGRNSCGTAARRPRPARARNGVRSTSVGRGWGRVNALGTTMAGDRIAEDASDRSSDPHHVLVPERRPPLIGYMHGTEAAHPYCFYLTERTHRIVGPPCLGAACPASVHRNPLRHPGACAAGRGFRRSISTASAKGLCASSNKGSAWSCFFSSFAGHPSPGVSRRFRNLSMAPLLRKPQVAGLRSCRVARPCP